MKKILLTTSLGLALCSALSAGQVAKIAKKHSTAKAVELEAYLKTNPDVDEKKKIIDHLLEIYGSTGNKERSIALYQERFDDLSSGADANLRAVQMTAARLLYFKFNLDDRAGAEKVSDAVAKKVAGHPAAARFLKGWSQTAAIIKMPLKGETMEVKFTSLKGKKVDLAAMKGKLVFIEFWSMSNIEDLPYVMKTYEKYHAKGFEVISISLDHESDKEKLKSFIKDKNIPWPQHFDGKGIKGDILAKYGAENYGACSFLISPDGTVLHNRVSAMHLEEMVKAYLPK